MTTRTARRAGTAVAVAALMISAAPVAFAEITGE